MIHHHVTLSSTFQDLNFFDLKEVAKASASSIVADKGSFH